MKYHRSGCVLPFFFFLFPLALGPLNRAAIQSSVLPPNPPFHPLNLIEIILIFIIPNPLNTRTHTHTLGELLIKALLPKSTPRDILTKKKKMKKKRKEKKRESRLEKVACDGEKINHVSRGCLFLPSLGQ